jgi:DNA replication protein DnaC/uncharacterized protein (DUF433 family)
MRKEQVRKNPRETSLTPKQDDNTSKSLELSEGQLEAHFRRLNLAHTRRIYKDVADRAEKEGWSYRDFLALLLAEEVARRKQTRLQRCTRSAHFPFFKTIDEFDFALQSTLRESVIGSCLGLDFVTEGRSLILHGKTGRGKTHLAVAIGYRAIQNGFETLFTTAAELIEDLSNASKRGNLQESLTTYTHPHVLVIDEVGYLTYGPDAANVLFHVVNDRHLRKRPMIFTTNKPMNDWGKVLHDEDMAAAILDRVLERGRFIHLDGPSGRTRHLNPEETLPENTKRLRISGIGGSEFPEPTSISKFDVPPEEYQNNSIWFDLVPQTTEVIQHWTNVVQPSFYEALWHVGPEGYSQTDLYSSGSNYGYLRRRLNRSSEDIKRAVSMNLQVVHGNPVFQGTRIPIYQIIEELADGTPLADIPEAYPSLTPEQIQQGLDFAASILRIYNE